MADKLKWSIDQAHSEVAFKVRHLMIAQVSGLFKVFDASIYTTGKDFTTAEIDLWIDASSISTGNINRDAHLKDNDFFDVEKYKQITFTSASLCKADANGHQELWGELTIRGITRKLKLDMVFGGMAIDPKGNEKVGFTVSGTLSRSDWGLVWNTILDTGGLVVGNEVSIMCELELINIGSKDLKMELKSKALATS
jgi:polyisoprenoid-binding protein YceI